MFDDRSLNDITDDEIDAVIVGRTRERQRLDFKSDFRPQNKGGVDPVIRDMLVDVSAMANAHGGYLIYGVDDRADHAAGYSSLALEDAMRISKSVRSLCATHVGEPIEGLEVHRRTVKGHHLVVVRIPKSGKAPHMVTYQDLSIFKVREDDNKRVMTIGELRTSFNEDLFGRRLARVERELSQLLDYMKARDSAPIKEEASQAGESGTEFSNQRFEDLWNSYE